MKDSKQNEENLVDLLGEDGGVNEPKTKQPKQEKTKTTSSEPSLVDSVPTTSSHYTYGFSYVALFKTINLISAITVGIIVGFFLKTFIFNFQLGGDGGAVLLSILFAGVVAFLIYYISNFGIKLFENIAIIAKTSVEIRDELSRKK